MVFCIIGLAVMQDNNMKQTIKYDCRLAEISPDYPVEVKTQCRKLMEK